MLISMLAVKIDATNKVANTNRIDFIKITSLLLYLDDCNKLLNTSTNRLTGSLVDSIITFLIIGI